VVGANTSGCTGSASVTVTVGVLPDVIVDVLPDEGCAPLTVTFDNHTTGASSFDWSFGDNSSSTDVSPVHTYYNQGTYPVTLVVTGQSGCTDTLSNLASIVVHPSPVADFSVEPGIGVVTTLSDATFTFLNHSLYANHYQWLWGDGSTDTFTSVNHTYQHAGDFNVTLIATNDYGCADSVTLYPVIVVDNGTVFIPNAFTPNGDGLNDMFKIYGTGIQSYTLSIYDRLGELVYQGDESTAGWDATFKGQPVNVAVFVYVVDITYDDGTKTNKKGDVTVVR
jgi:gliding motility-associated-like protein